MKRIVSTLAICSAFLLCSTSAFGQTDYEENQQIPDSDIQKRAQTGMKFLKMSVDPRAGAMADALTSMEGSASAMFYNPAGMARMSGSLSASFGQTQWIQDIGYNYGSLAFAPAGGSYGVFGVSFMAVDYGDLEGTIRADNDAGYTDIGLFSPTAMVVGIGYAKALTDRFAVGGNVKYALQDLTPATVSAAAGDPRADQKENVLAFDFGVLYKTGFRSLNFAMSARNFSQEVKYEDESFELPLTFTIGVSMDMMDLTSMDKDMHSFIMAVDAERPRDFAEHLNIGGEYTFMKTFSLRGGYAFPTDLEGLHLGFGVQGAVNTYGISADYSYSDMSILGDVHRIAFRLGL